MMLTSSLFLALVPTAVLGLNILLTNDDSWASANIRATYAALKKDGHDVLLVGPAVQQSGKGGTFVLPTTNIVAPGGEFGSIPVGAPFFGQDPTDKNIWYFNGTPAASAVFGIDLIAPKHFGRAPIDLVVSGPNEGQNAGPFLYTLSGTIGATYASVERDLPAIAFSAGNGTHRSFTTNTGAKNDPANLAAEVVARLVRGLTKGVKKQERLLPLGVGLNVNLPNLNSTCSQPDFVLTRMTGGAFIDKLSINPTTGFPQFANFASKGLNTCLNGRCSLPGETPVAAGCKTSVSVFSVDYDAPTGAAAGVQARLNGITGHHGH